MGSDAIGGLTEPGAILAYTWKEATHQPHVAALKELEDLIIGPLPFPLLDELHSRFLSHYAAGESLTI